MPISRRHLLVALGLALPVTISPIAPAAAETVEPMQRHAPPRPRAPPSHPAPHMASRPPRQASQPKLPGPPRRHAAGTPRHRRPRTAPQTPPA